MPGWMKILGITCLLAVLANGVMVWQALHTQHDLVRKDYYEAGLDQDGRIARTSLANSKDWHISFLKNEKGFRVEAKRDTSHSNTNNKNVLPTTIDPLSLRICQVQFYRPDNVKEDFKQEFFHQPDSSTAISIWQGPSVKLRRGHWRITLLWIKDQSPLMEKTFDYFSPG